MQRDKALTVAVEADTSGFDLALKQAGRSAEDFGRSFSSTLRNSIASGKSFEDTLRSIALRLSSMAFDKAMAPVENMMDTMFGSLFSGFAGGGGGFGLPKMGGSAGSFSASGLMAFAKGGVVGGAGSGATLFSYNGQSAGGLGVMAEKGAEAIMPLARGSDGRLGIAAAGGSGVNVVFNVQARDEASFRRSEGQLTAMLARAVARGQRNL